MCLAEVGKVVGPNPTHMQVGASNELPESEELDALYDRFLIRRRVSQARPGAYLLCARLHGCITCCFENLNTVRCPWLPNLSCFVAVVCSGAFPLIIKRKRQPSGHHNTYTLHTVSALNVQMSSRWTDPLAISTPLLRRAPQRTSWRRLTLHGRYSHFFQGHASRSFKLVPACIMA